MKKFKGKNQVFLILAALVLMFAAAALAQGPGQGPGCGRGGGDRERGPEHRLEVLTERLELTEEQVVAISKIMEQGREESIALRKEMMRLQNELEGEMLKDAPSEKTAVGLVENMGKLKTEARVNGLKNRLAIREQLTPEQRDKMLMMKGRSGKGQGRRGGPGRAQRCGGTSNHECDGTGPGRTHGGGGSH